MDNIRGKVASVSLCAFLLLGSFPALGKSEKDRTREELLELMELKDKVRGEVILLSVSIEGDGYCFQYSCNSSTESVQSIEGIRLGVIGRPDKVISPPDWFSTAEGGIFVADNRRVGATGLMTVSWYPLGVRGSKDIKPGTCQKGFEIITKGLPGITRFWIEGRPGKERILGRPSEAEIKILRVLLDPFNNSYNNAAIGPEVISADNLKSTVFLLDRLYKITTECNKLEWITDRKIGEYLEIQLRTSLHNMNLGKREEACVSFQKYIREIERNERENGDVIRPDALVMLSFNGKYLGSRMCKY